MRKIFLQTLMAAALLMLAACSGGADAVSKKIDNHEKLSQSDYSLMIDYIEDVFTQLTDATNKYGREPKKLQEECEALEKKFPHTEQFTQAIISATDLDASNQKKLEKLQGIILQALGINPETMRSLGNPQISVPEPAGEPMPKPEPIRDLPDTLSQRSN